MKHLITKLLLLVMVGVLGIPINGYATDLYLTGKANSMESKDVHDWYLSKKVSSDSSNEAYFWVEGEFAVSSSNSTDWTTFNNSRIKFENNKLDWSKHENSDIGASSSNRLFVKVTFEMGNDKYTTSTTPFSGHEGVWGSTSVTYTYYIHFGDDMTANAGSDLQLTAGTDVKKSGINGQKFRVYSKTNTGDIVWYGSNNSLNQSGQTQVNLSANGSAITLPSKDGEFTFNLTINGTTPQSIMVTAPNGDVTTYDEIYLVGGVTGDNWTSTSIPFSTSDGVTYTLAARNFGANETFKIWNKTTNTYYTYTGTLTDGAYIPATGGTDNEMKFTTAQSAVSIQFNNGTNKQIIFSGIGGGDTQKYTVYVDVTGPVEDNKNNGWKTTVYAQYKDFGCDEVDATPLTKVEGNLWKLEIPGATKAGKVIFFCYSYLPTSNSERYRGRTDEFSGVKDGNVYVLPKLGDAAAWFYSANVGVISPDRAGKYYLVGDIINDNYLSPAWELKQDGNNNTYILQPFAMRNCTVSVIKYDDNGISTQFTPKYINGMPEKVTVNGTDNRQPGILCTAEYDPSSDTLTFTRVNNDVTDYVPYVGILGENFKQATKYPTRQEGFGMGDTKQGWQEAFIEYGNDGKPRFDADGVTAYYNTIWPPRNNILLQSDQGNGVTPLNISTAETTMRRDSKGVMTGSEWKAYLGEGNTYYDELKLTSGTSYYRFYVSDMWMLGAFKIWTGWGGERIWRDKGYNNWRWEADWEKFWYWGPGSDNVDIITGKTTDASKDGNFQTTNGGKDRVYYRTMEVFIPVDGDKLSPNNVKIYLTQTPGGAQIDSYVKDNKTGAYLPELTADMPTGCTKVKSYKIVRYQYAANTDISNLKQVGVDGTTYENRMDNPAPEALVSENTNCNFTSKTAFNDYFTKTIADANDANKKYVEDADLAAGMYKYCMEVVFSDKDGNNTTTAKVWSPYIQIVETEYVLTATCGQLVKLNAEDSDKYNAHYLVYNEQNINNGMLISLDESKHVTIAKRLSTMIPGSGDQQAEETRKIATKIFEETGTWTNMAGFMTSAPSKFVSDAAIERKIDGVILYRNDGTGEVADWKNVETFTQLNNNLFVIRDRVDDLKRRDYRVEFSGTIKYKESESSETTVNKAVYADDILDYTPTFPLPYFGTPEVKIVKDLDADDHSEFASLLTASHDHVDHIRPNAAYGLELQAKVPVHMPNIDANVREDVYSLLTVKFNGKTAAPVASATEHYLQYRYQSPYDWITNGGDGNACDASSWTAKKLDWKLDGSAYAAPIKSYKSANSKQTVEATVTPTFANPDASTALSPMYGVAIVYQEPVEGREKNFIEAASQEHEYYARLSLNTFGKPGCADKIGGTKLLEKSDGAVFMAHVVAPEDADMTGKTLFNYLMPVSETTGEKPSLGGDNNDQYTNLATGHIIAQMHLDKRTVQLAINSGSSAQWQAIYNTAKDFFKTLKVEYGFAHHFKTGVDHENLDATKCQSKYVGFTGDFPYLRHDHQDQTAAAPARETRTPSKTMTWQGEDNAYVLSPVYASTSITADDIFTDIKNIADDMLNVEVGTGYIDMLGNDGRIFAADGREVYVGAGRAEVGQGVYMVVLPGKTLKVMVK